MKSSFDLTGFEFILNGGWNMNISGSGSAESSAAMYSRFMQLNKAGLAGMGPSGFGQLMALASRNVTIGLPGFYGMSVGARSVPKDEREIAHRDKSRGLKEMMIPSRVAEKMRSNSTLGYNLIIHEDGTWTIGASREKLEEGRQMGTQNPWLGMTTQTPFMTSAITGDVRFSPDTNSNANPALLQKLNEARALQRYYASSLISPKGGLLL